MVWPHSGSFFIVGIGGVSFFIVGIGGVTAAFALCRLVQANVAHKRHNVLPVPVGLSSSACLPRECESNVRNVSKAPKEKNFMKHEYTSLQSLHYPLHVHQLAVICRMGEVYWNSSNIIGRHPYSLMQLGA